LDGYQTVPVLSYHRFSKTEQDSMTVTEMAFEKQMRFLKENGYRVITLEEFFDFLDFKRQIPRKSVVITIDDGWRSVHDIALPILKKYGYPATLFVYTDLIMRSNMTLTWEQVSELARSGIVTIQCHTKTHRNLVSEIDQEPLRKYFDEVKGELTDSRTTLHEHLGAETEYLAYPYGETSPLVVALLERLGYRGAFTVERGTNPFFVHPYRIKRSMIYGDFDLNDFQKNLVTWGNRALR
jgi:peptidoglycan/xylan/chitin deacetylase (PgdA/CDA1 family)